MTMVTRPRDRGRQILAAAAGLFWRHGFHRVGMSEIAASVGIGASALYRHYRGKEDLLTAVIDESLDALEAALAAAPPDFAGTMAAVGEVVLARREFGVLWDREGGQLPAEQRRAVRRRLRRNVERIAVTMPKDGLMMRARAITAMEVSVSYHQYKVDADQLCRIAEALRTVELPAPEELPVGGRDPQPLVSRREAVLVVATRLFAERGFPSVSLADIGTAAGISAPSVYNHFASKHDLLIAALTRGTESLWLSLHHVLRTADGPADAVSRAVDGYLSFATANPDIVRLLLTELLNVPPEQQEALARTRHEYAAELVALLQRARPGLAADPAWVLVLGAVNVINALTQLPYLRGRAEIGTFAHAVLWS
jgi:AcrR family transcriptional regulator